MRRLDSVWEKGSTADAGVYPIVSSPNDALRQPRAPKPHVMRFRGWWWLVDRPWGSWQQREPITTEPRAWKR